jgi:hypothetical protein
MDWKQLFHRGKTTSKSLPIYRLPKIEDKTDLDIYLDTTTVFVSSEDFCTGYWSHSRATMYKINGLVVNEGNDLTTKLRFLVVKTKRRTRLVYNRGGWSTGGGRFLGIFNMLFEPYES